MTNRPQEDLRAIRDIMDRSRRFRALSGWSGVVAGVVALIGVVAAVVLVYGDWSDPFVENIDRIKLLGIAAVTLAVAAGGAWYFTRAKMLREAGGRSTARNFFGALSVPLMAGGLLAVILLLEGYDELVPAITLIFYGTALIQASGYSIRELGGLGWLELTLGLVAVLKLDYSLPLWALGFGVLHIAYGIYVGIKYRP